MLFAVAALAFPVAGVASGQPVLPPENSAANQYTETLPGAGGNEPTGKIGGGGGGSPKKALGKAHAARLEALGPAGRAAARLAAAAAPTTFGRQSGAAVAPGAVGKHVGAEPAANPGGKSGLRQILGQITGSSGSGEMGLLLPLLITMAAIAAIAFAVIRRQAATNGD